MGSAYPMHIRSDLRRLHDLRGNSQPTRYTFSQNIIMLGGLKGHRDILFHNFRWRGESIL
jgi:hypothetical protein